MTEQDFQDLADKLKALTRDAAEKIQAARDAIHGVQDMELTLRKAGMQVDITLPHINAEKPKVNYIERRLRY